VYGPVPPEAPLVEIVVASLTSTGLWVADRVPAETAGSTVKDSVALPVPPLASVTVRVTVNGDPVEEVGVQLNDVPEPLHPVGRPDQEYVYGPVPPEAPLVEIVVASLTSTGLWVADRVPEESKGSTVSVNVFVTALPLESVTTTCTVYGLPELELGVQLNDANELLHPAGRPDQEYV